MKCPYCENICREGSLYCPKCKQPLTGGVAETKKAPEPKKPEGLYSLVRFLFITLCWIASIAIIGLGVYKLYFWIEDYNINRMYTRGEFSPSVSQIALADGRSGHAISFFGNDGDQIFLPELGRSFAISGGVARVELADCDWFDTDVTQVQSAIVVLTPTLIEESGDQQRLPSLEITVETPSAPISITSPARDSITVSTAVYPLELQVVPGSTLILNGEDVSDKIDRLGAFAENVTVEPIGANIYTMLVRTPKHIETRREIIINRAQLDIEVELDTSVGTTSNTKHMTVSGYVEPGAMISVDTEHVAESVYIDMVTGRFSFLTNFNVIGNNVVRFRATMDGREDAVLSFSVYYVPNLADYSGRAWKMDYPQLSRYFEQWTGRVFLCEGEVYDVFNDDGVQHIIMDVSTDSDTRQYVVLINASNMGTPIIGRVYTAYADVQGRYMYNTNYYPLLSARYMYVKE